MVDLEGLLMLAGGGLFVGGLYYAYSKNLIPLDDILDEKPAQEDPEPENPALTGGGYSYYSKKKIQCRDNHLTAAYLRSQGVKVINWKVYNDGKIYAQQCGTPSPFWVLVAVPLGDGQSGGILSSFGFSQYMPPQQELNPNVPIPPPSSNFAFARRARQFN